jgi:hypothetical protein
VEVSSHRHATSDSKSTTKLKPMKQWKECGKCHAFSLQFVSLCRAAYSDVNLITCLLSCCNGWKRDGSFSTWPCSVVIRLRHPGPSALRSSVLPLVQKIPFVCGNQGPSLSAQKSTTGPYSHPVHISFKRESPTIASRHGGVQGAWRHIIPYFRTRWRCCSQVG